MAAFTVICGVCIILVFIELGQKAGIPNPWGKKGGRRR